MRALRRSHTEAPADADLVARVLAGDRDGYASLVERHQAQLYRHALGMTRDSDVAADLVQDSFIRGYTALGGCQDPSRFGSWIFRILRNRCLDHLKNRRRSNVSLEDVTVPLTGDLEDPEVELGRSEIRREVRDALEGLPEAQREAFLLKHVDGFSYEEMAEMLGASVSALKMRVMRAREALQVALGALEEADL